jgi:hypothetical protein
LEAEENEAGVTYLQWDLKEKHPKRVTVTETVDSAYEVMKPPRIIVTNMKIYVFIPIHLQQLFCALLNLQTFLSRLPKFIQHQVAKTHQHSMFVLHKDSAMVASSGVMVLHFDFSENYTCQSQDQIQSAYYSQDQVSLFTFVVYYMGVTTSGIIASDDLDHSKRSVIANLHMLIKVSLDIQGDQIFLPLFVL